MRYLIFLIFSISLISDEGDIVERKTFDTEIYKKDLKHFYNLEYFVVDCLRVNPHPSHFNLNEVLNLIKKIKPKKTILTNLHSDLDYNYLLKILPKNVQPAYDGLSFYI